MRMRMIKRNILVRGRTCSLTHFPLPSRCDDRRHAPSHLSLKCFHFSVMNVFLVNCFSYWFWCRGKEKTRKLRNLTVGLVAHYFWGVILVDTSWTGFDAMTRKLLFHYANWHLSCPLQIGLGSC